MTTYPRDLAYCPESQFFKCLTDLDGFQPVGKGTAVLSDDITHSNELPLLAGSGHPEIGVDEFPPGVATQTGGYARRG